MKKNLFIVALCALATFAFTSCEKPGNGEEPTTDVKVEVSPATLSLSVGASSERLVAKVTPAGVNVTVTWSSSDESVATVRAGVVTAVAEGVATITATAGTATATCVVTVSDDAVLDNYVISDWGVFNKGDMIPNTERTVHFVSGDSAKCQLGYATVNFWDNSLTYVEGSGFTGTGLIAIAELPLYWIIEGEYAGSYVGNQSGFMVGEIEGDYAPYTAKAGAIVDETKYGDFFKQIAAYNKDTTQKPNVDLYQEAFEGTQMFILYANDNFATSYNVANVKAAQLVEDENDNKLYAAEIEWLDFFSADRYFGLKATIENNKLVSVDEPYDMRYIVKQYTNTETSSEVVAAQEKYVIGNAKRMHLNDKVAQKQLSTLNLYKK